MHVKACLWQQQLVHYGSIVLTYPDEQAQPVIWDFELVQQVMASK